jgi:hypothetical protein
LHAIRNVKNHVGRRHVALVSLVIAAIAIAVVTTQRGASARVPGAVRALNPATVATFPRSAARKPLWCKLQHRRFHTLPGFRPEGICMARRAGMRLAPDKILVTPRPDSRLNRGEQYGLMMLSGSGQLLWYEPRPNKPHDFKTITYRGKPALAYFQTQAGGGHYQLLDQHYRPLAQIRPGHGFRTNLHELQVTPRGTAYISADVPVHVPRLGTVIDFVVQEVDIATGDVLFQWRALDHVPPSDSYERRPGHGRPWDFFHGNAIAAPVDGHPTVIISSRNTSSLYGVDRGSGKTSWILGGKRDQFHLSRSAFFCAQHDAHRLPNGDVMLFDNGGTYMHGEPHCPPHPARALTLSLDTPHHTAKVVRSISSAQLPGTRGGLFPGWVGSARMESNGDTLIDWGPPNRVTAVTPDGRLGLLLRVQRWTYRAMPGDWTGLPDGAPAIAAQRHGGVVQLWASWNGATEIRRWQVLVGDTPSSLAPLARPVAFRDLETHIAAQTDARFVAVRALDANGASLGESRAVAP